MGFSVFDPVTQDQATQTAVDRANQQKRAKETLTPDVADRVREIYKKAPYIPASVILSMAKAGTSDTTIDAVKTQSARVTAASLDPNRKPKQSWFERNVMSHVKSATRWGFAGLQLLPDLAQNAASQVFSPNDPAGSEGWFRSTNLGTMFANSGQAGSGFFMGEEAAKSQAEKAREFRGTVNGHAWTVGRGAAQLAFTPGSVAYNVLSGFIDGAVQIGADPTTYLGPKVKELRAARAAIPSLIGEDAMKAASALAKGEAGLEAAESLAFTQSKFGKWVSTDRRAVRLTNRIAEIAANQSDTLEAKTQKILENFNYSISPEIAAEFAKADEVGKVQGILGAASAKLASNPDEILLPSDVRDLRLSKIKSNLFDDAAERFPLLNGLRNNRYFSMMPKGSVVVNGSGLDRAEAIKNYSNYLKGIGIGVNSPEYRNVMDNVVKAYSMVEPGVQRPAVQEAFNTAFETIAKHAGMKGKKQEDVIRAVIAKANEEMSKARAYNVDEIGWADDGGMVQLLRKYAPEGALDHIDRSTWDRLAVQGPGLLSELANEVVVLPDFRKMRRLSGMARFATSTKAGDQRGIIAVTEALQNEIWKPLTLATGGYIMRNMMDAQTRIAMNGLSGAFRHPMDFIMWAMHKKGFEDIAGKEFENLSFWKKMSQDLPNMQKEYADAVSFDHYRHLDDPQLAYERQLRNGNWSLVSRGIHPQAHTTGYVDNLALLHNSPESLRLSQLAAMNVDPEQRLAMVKDWLMSDAGKKSKETFAQYIRNGIRYTDPETGMQGIIKLGDNIPDEVLTGWVDRMTNFRINTITRGDYDLNIVAGYNRVPLQVRDGAGHLRTAPRETVKIDDLSPSDFLSGDGGLGSIINLGEDRHGLVIGRRAAKAGEIDPFTGEMLAAGDVLTVQPIHTTDAFQGFLGSPELRNMIDTKGLRGELATIVKRAERGMKTEKPLMQEAIAAKNKFVEAFFGQFYGGLTRTFEKSPVFRQLYYREVGKFVDELAPAEAQKMLDRIVEASASTGIKAERYVGDKATLDKLKQVAKSTSEATGTVDMLDEYAKAVALRNTKEMLYNATERNNLEDILRIVVPFGPAWREVLGNYMQALIEDPSRVRRAQLIFDGARKFDPDGNGQGFFYKDPTTGQYMFNFPFSGEVNQLVTGMNAPLQAPVKQMSIGLGVIPSIGPVAQIAASKLIPDTPDTDFITNILLPYGKKGGMDFVPRWASRLNEAISGNTMNTATVFGNTYVETVRALSASGEYDLSQESEQERLYADAKQKARLLTGIRALAQFIGPTSPTTEFVVPTKEGDIYSSQLVKEFQKLQTENYDTAVQRFLEIYGNDALLYVSNKTQSVKGGLEASTAFGNWERENQALFNAYPDVAGFMAPGGDNFSFAVWSRQLATGKRRRLTDREMVELAQYRVASAKYRELRDKLPTNPTDDQRRWLRNWRIQLNKEYPGFPAVAEFNPGQFPAQIEQMKRMVADPRLQGNDVADALKTYLDARDQAIERATQAGYANLSSIAATPLRDWLSNVGKALKVDTPEFARIYDRLLANEIED